MSSVPEAVLADAKRIAESLAARGKLLTPEEAWLLSGETRDAQTLWSIAFQLGMRTDTSAEEINAWLEQHFPQYVKNEKGPFGSSDSRPSV